jgi:hypothetical protein
MVPAPHPATLLMVQREHTPLARKSPAPPSRQQPVADLAPAAPIVPVPEPGFGVAPIVPAALPTVVPVLAEPGPFMLLVPALEPKVVEPEPARSNAPLPVELEEPSGVPVPVVPDKLPPVVLAAPCAVVVPAVLPSALLSVVPAVPTVLLGVVPLRPGAPRVPVPGAVATPDGFAHGAVEPVIDPDDVCASAKPAAVANAEAVTSAVNFFLLAFISKLLGD